MSNLNEEQKSHVFLTVVVAVGFCAIGMASTWLAFYGKEHSKVDAFPPGQLVRHRMDGRLGIVLSNSGSVQVRFSCNYTTSSNFEVITCEPFELVVLTKEDEENLYWRRRERPTHSPDQTELP